MIHCNIGEVQQSETLCVAFTNQSPQLSPFIASYCVLELKIPRKLIWEIFFVIVSGWVILNSDYDALRNISCVQCHLIRPSKAHLEKIHFKSCRSLFYGTWTLVWKNEFSIQTFFFGRPNDAIEWAIRWRVLMTQLI